MKTPSQLLSPIKLGSLELKNRVFMAPLTRARSGPDRVPNEQMVEYYRQRASAGLLITEAVYATEDGLGWVETPGIYNDAQVEAWQKVTQAVHDQGGHIFMQIWHSGRSSHSAFWEDGRLPVAPSAIKIEGSDANTPQGKLPYEVPHAMTTEEVQAATEYYAKGAARAVEAGFDGVEIHAANGYLIDQFLQSKTNQRDDQYGGSIENRFRFLKEVLENVLKVLPADRVGVRLAPNGIFNDMGSPDYRESFLQYAKWLNEYKLGYLHVLDGLGFGFHELGEPLTLADFKTVYDGLLVGNVGYTQETAEAAIAKGDADAIAFGRSFMSNPDLVERFTNNWPLAAEAPQDTWWMPSKTGLIDFPAYQAV